MLARTSCIGEAPGREGGGDSGTAAGERLVPCTAPGSCCGSDMAVVARVVQRGRCKRGEEQGQERQRDGGRDEGN